MLLIFKAARLVIKNKSLCLTIQYCVRQLKSLKHIANFLNEDIKKLLVKLVNLPKSLLQHLDCVINSDLRFIYTVEPFSMSLICYQAELVLRFTRITKQFFALKLI